MGQSQFLIMSHRTEHQPDEHREGRKPRLEGRKPRLEGWKPRLEGWKRRLRYQMRCRQCDERSVTRAVSSGASPGKCHQDRVISAYRPG